MSPPAAPGKSHSGGTSFLLPPRLAPGAAAAGGVSAGLAGALRILGPRSAALVGAPPAKAPTKAPIPPRLPSRPFFCVLETPGSGNVVRLVNTAPVEFPMTASVVPGSINNEMSTGAVLGGDVVIGGDVGW